MQTYAEKMAEEQRRLMLDAMMEDAANGMNERSLKLVLAQFMHVVGGDVIRAHLEFLERHRLVRLDKLQDGAAELWCARLTGAGADVQGGVAHVGIARPRIRG